MYTSTLAKYRQVKKAIVPRFYTGLETSYPKFLIWSGMSFSSESPSWWKTRNLMVSLSSRSNMTIGTRMPSNIITFAGVLTLMSGKWTTIYRELIIPKIKLREPASRKFMMKLPITVDFIVTSVF
jgi:hypothetical protein